MVIWLSSIGSCSRCGCDIAHDDDNKMQRTQLSSCRFYLMMRELAVRAGLGVGLVWASVWTNKKTGQREMASIAHNHDIGEDAWSASR